MDQNKRLEIFKCELVAAPKFCMGEHEFKRRLASIDRELEFLDQHSGVDHMKPALRRMRALLVGAKIVQRILESSKIKENNNGNRP